MQRKLVLFCISQTLFNLCTFREFTIYVVRYFGQSLRYGNQYIYQSMPRLLSLWLDYGSMVVDAEKKEKGKSSQKLQTQRTILDRLNKVRDPHESSYPQISFWITDLLWKFLRGHQPVKQ